MKTFDLSLYLVLDPELCSDIGMIETARAAVAGGATMVQLRDKGADTASLIETGILTTASNVLFSGGNEGYFYALDARTGALLWKVPVGASSVPGHSDIFGLGASSKSTLEPHSTQKPRRTVSETACHLSPRDSVRRKSFRCSRLSRSR